MKGLDIVDLAIISPKNRIFSVFFLYFCKNSTNNITKNYSLAKHAIIKLTRILIRLLKWFTQFILCFRQLVYGLKRI